MVAKSSGKDAVGANTDLQKFVMFTGVVAVLFLFIKVVTNKKYWWRMEITVGVICALAIPFAGYLSPYFIKSDTMSTYLLRLLMTPFVAQAAAVYLTQQSSDKTASAVVSISSFLGRVPLLLSIVTVLYQGQIITKHKDLAYIDVALLTLLVAGDLYHIINAEMNSYRHRTVGDPVSLHLSIDALITFFLGSLLLGFPDMFFTIVSSSFRTASVHMMLAKWFGIMLLAGSMLSFASICYREVDDAVSTLKSKLLVYLPTLLLSLTNILIDGHCRTFGYTAIMIGVVGGLAFNAGAMVYRHEKEE